MNTTINLHQASELEIRLGSRVKACADRITSSSLIDLFQDPVAARAAMQAKVRAFSELSDRLDALRYVLRERIAQKNVASGVSERLGRIKCLVARRDRLEKLNSGAIAAAEQALNEELSSRRKRFEGFAPSATYGQDSRYDLMPVALFSADAKIAFVNEIRDVELDITKTKNELSALNGRITIDLNESELELLRKEGLLP